MEHKMEPVFYLEGVIRADHFESLPSFSFRVGIHIEVQT